MSEALKQRYAKLHQSIQIWYAGVSRGKVLKWTVIAIFCALFAWGVTAQAEGRLGLSTGVSNDNRWIGQELMLAHKNWYGSAARLGGDKLLPDTVRLAVGYRVRWRNERRFSPYLRLGGAYFMDEPTDIISDRWAYDMSIGFRLFNVIDTEYQHNSTAGRSLQNSGNDMILVGVVIGSK